MYTLPDLPYGYDALAPVLSAETLRFHHDKHHAAYVKKANELAEKAGLANQALFNNAAQAWNHGFFWQSMSPRQSAPGGALREAIDRSFGGLDGLKQRFVEEGVGHFASGWVWLTATGDEPLEVISTHDADDTFTQPAEYPLLTCDVWEHAYYLDYKNDRKAFLERWFDELANWDFASRQFAARHNPVSGWRYPANEQVAG
jgi:superoxide dismutase, Fe-Mn family